MNDDLEARLRRVYAAIGETQESDVSKFPATVVANEKGTLIYQDFSGGRTEEQLTNAIQTLIALIASLEYHLCKWAGKNGHDVAEIKRPLRASKPFSIIQDLWNNEKHGYAPGRGSDKSGFAPQLINVIRVMKLAPQRRKGSSVMLTVGPNGMPVIGGDGTATALITGDVVGKDGQRVGDAHQFLEGAVTDCEELLRTLGIS